MEQNGTKRHWRVMKIKRATTELQVFFFFCLGVHGYVCVFICVCICKESQRLGSFTGAHGEDPSSVTHMGVNRA